MPCPKCHANFDEILLGTALSRLTSFIGDNNDWGNGSSSWEPPQGARNNTNARAKAKVPKWNVAPPPPPAAPQPQHQRSEDAFAKSSEGDANMNDSERNTVNTENFGAQKKEGREENMRTLDKMNVNSLRCWQNIKQKI